MREKYQNGIVRLVVVCLALFLLVAPAMAATTQVQIVKYANDRTTILNQTTVTYQWMMANLPVLGDGTTHYYQQGPVFVDDVTNETHEQELRWNMAEDTNVDTKDMGAVKGTNVKDLTDLVGGMNAGEEVKILAADGWSDTYAYKNVYEYSAREGPIGITWYKNGQYPDTGYSDGMRMIWFADDSVNKLGPGGTGLHAFGNFDWHEAAAPEYWYYNQQGGENYPTTTGLSGYTINRVHIYSDEVPPVAPVAAFSGTPLSGFAPFTVQFTDASTGTPTSWAWDFNNDGVNESTSQNPSYIYNTAGTYTVKLSVTNAAGSDSEIKTGYITVNSAPVAPVAAFSGTPLTGNAPLTVQFTDASTGSITGYAWDFNNDGTTDSTAQSPSYQYTSAGSYTVKLTVTGPGGFDDETKINYVTVSTPPSPEYNLLLTGDHAVTLTKAQLESIVASGQSVTYTDTSNGRTWNGIPLWYLVSAVDDSDTGFNFNNTRAAMNYVVQIRAGDAFFKNFTSSTIAGSSNYIVANTLNGIAIPFTDPSNPAKLWWPLKHVGPGMSSGNSVGNITEIRLIGLPVLPVANFTATPLAGTAPLSVQFTDTSTGTSPLTYAWDFNNDGITDSTVQNPSFAYTAAGTYTVKLTVTNSEGSDSETKTDSISVTAPPVAPVAAFSGTPLSGDAPLTVQFTDASSGSITGYAWDFNNDGITDSTAQSPSYQYTSAGTYTVKLTVTGPGGSDDETKVDYITVTSAPVVDTLFDGTVTLTPDTKFTLVPYNNLGTSYQVNSTTPLGALDSVNKSLGIRVDVTDKNFSGRGILMVDNIGAYLYSKSGSITKTWICQVNGVTLDDFGHNATDGLNIKSLATGDQVNFYYGIKPVTPTNATAVVKITVNIPSPAAPVAAFSGTPLSGTVPLTVAFTDASTGTITGYAWDFNNDGTTDSTVQSPSYQYTSAGTYTVNLTVMNTGGNDSEVKTDYITVNTAPVTPALLWGPYLTGTTTTGTVVNAKTNIATTVSVEYATDAYYTANTAYDKTATDSVSTQLHHVSLAGLTPDTLYHYRVVYAGQPTADLHFSTFPESGVFTFVMYSDTQDQLPTYSQLERHKLVADRIAQESDVAFVLNSGDLVNDAANLSDWDRYFAAGSMMMANTTVYPALGNHDANNANYYQNYGVPEYYSFDCADAHVAVLDSNNWADYPVEGTWLANDLQTDKQFKFVSFHHPLYTSESSHFGGWTNLKQAWESDINDNGVLAVFNGHVHAYERLFVNDTNYFVAGIGGAPSYNLATPRYTASQKSLEYMIGYIRVTVDPAARTATAQVIRVADVSSDLKTLTTVYPAGTVFETVVMSLPVSPVANFTATPLSGNAPLSVQFTDTSTGTPASWEWDFDNNGIIDNTTRSPSYAYATAGTYTVNLTVTNAKGSDSEVKTGYISVSATPAITELFNGTVMLTPGETFTKHAYNNATGIYTVNRTTPLGALNVAATTAGFTYDVTDKNYATSGLLLDNIGTYLYQKTPRKAWYAYVNDVYKDGYNNKPNALNIIELIDGDRVEFYYVNGTVADATNLAAVKANASAAVKTVADTTPGPTINVLFDGTVMLTPGETFTKVAYNSGTSYTVNRTTPLGALNVAATTAGFTYDVTDKNYVTSGLLLDNIGTYLYQKTPRKAWYAYVNDVYKDGYNNKPNALNVIELINGDRVEFYYVNGTVADATNLAAVKANASAAVKTVASTGVIPTDWSIVLDGAKTQTVTKTYFEQGLACSSSGHQVNWTDTDGNVWSGVPLWLLVGMIDDNPDIGPDHFNFNDSIAAQGYSVKVSSGDNWNTTLASADIARNDGYIVANTLNGEPLPINLTSGKLSWPLHLKGSAVFGGQQVGNITKIELTGLPQPPAGWTLTLQGDVTDVITQSYFEEAIACHHNVTWTDTSGNTWEGVSLWDLAGVVDDFETTSHYTFNDTRATMGYTIRVSAGDGFNATFASADVAHNDGYFLAHKMNGVALTGSAAPLRLVGPSTTSGSQRIGNVVKISLEGLPDQFPAGDWQLTLNGKIIDVIPQGEFEYWASHHSATYTDTNGNVYTGIPLWRLMGWVDDQIPHGSNGFNDAAATAGYKVIVKAGDGYAKEFTSQQIGKTDAFIVANTMNGSSLPTAGDHPPYPLRLVGSGATGGNSVGNIVEIQLTDFLTPVEAPKLHIVKYGSDGTTIINETTIDYHYMEDNLQVIGDGVTHYQYQGLTLDPTDLWDPTETKGMNPPKIDNAIKGTKVKDLVELVGGMGTGTDITFIASDGYETKMGYSNIYTNPYVQSQQGDAVMAWYADGQYVPQYSAGMRFFFTPADHVFGQWNMHEAMDEKYWHYNWQGGVQYPSAAGTSNQNIIEIKIYSSPESDWQIELDGSDIGGVKTNISKTYLEQALACQFGSEHKATYTDTKGNTWEGMPLWFFAGFVDDADQHSNKAFNESLASVGYRVVITAGDGYNATIDSPLIIRSTDYIVANSLNGSHIKETDSNWPLLLTGVNVTGSSAVKNITSIRLVKNLPLVPIANFSSDVQTGTIPLKVNFTDLSTGLGPLTYAWDFDNDGITDDTTRNPSYTYATAGTYTVNLTVTNAAGSDSEVKAGYISGTSEPVIDEWSITLNGAGNEQLTRVNFESLAESKRLTYTDAKGTWSGIALWRLLACVDDSDPATFSDALATLGYTVNVSAPNFAATIPSQILVRNDTWIVADTLNGTPLPKQISGKNYWPLKIVGPGLSGKQLVGNISMITLENLPSVPVAAFTSDVQPGTAPLNVNFTDQSSGTGQFAYAWDFDNDGITDNTTQNPSYTYATAGTYTVNLTVTNAAGSDSEVKAGYVSVTSEPVIDEWSITLNGAGNEQLTRVNFESLAESNRLTYTDAKGTWSGIALWRLLARVDDSDPATFSDALATLGYTVNVSAPNFAATIPSQILVRNDTWIVADTLNGTPLPKQISGKNYWPLKIVGPGLSGKQLVGNISMITLENLPSAPVAAFTSDVQTGTVPLKVNFTDQSTGTGQLTYAWDFDNNGITDSTEQSPIYIYTAAGTYSVNLTVTNGAGSDFEVKTGYIIVTAVPVAPVAGFSSDVQTGAAPLTVQFTDASTGTPTSWAWDFTNDGIIDSTKQSPSHIYDTAGTYTVNLTVTNAGGSDSEVKTGYITVTAVPVAPVAGFSSDVQTGTAPLTVKFTDASTGTGQLTYAWDFNNDGTTDSTLQSPTYIYSAAGTYSVNLTVMNAGGSDSEVKTGYITVTAAQVAPVAAFSSDIQTGTSPLSVTFTDQSTGSPTSWYWTFGDGTTSTKQNPVHSFTTSRRMATYTVSLTVSNAMGHDKITKTQYITVTPPPVPDAAFTTNVTSGKSPLAVQFTDQSTGSPTSWRWSFGDGKSSTGQNPVHTYTTGKKTETYTVSLTVTNSRGKDEITKTGFITVYPTPVPPVAAFTSDKHTGSAPLTVRFMDQSTGTGPFTYAWDFNNDGTVDSTMQNPGYVYNAPGTYAVKLVVTGPGGTDAEVKNAYIIVKAAPVKPTAIFTSDVQSGQSPLTVKFADQSTGSPTFWYWTFGDGTSSIKQNPIHTYVAIKKPQTFTVTLTVTNAKGTDKLTKTSYITVIPAPVPPVAAFTSDKQTGSSPLTVRFTDQSTGTGPFTYAWDFNNDGTVDSTMQNPGYVYNAPGTYAVKLVVTGPGGTDAEVKNTYIIVKAAPVKPTAIFMSDVQSGQSPLTVKFADQSTGSPTFWYWTFGDGTSSTKQNPMHTYTASKKAQTYTVTLTVTNVKGTDKLTKTSYITVIPEPSIEAQFIANVTSGRTPLAVQFTDQSTMHPTSWYWTFGDGTSSTKQNPVHTYRSLKNVQYYTVTLTVSNVKDHDALTKTSYIKIVNNPPITILLE